MVGLIRRGAGALLFLTAAMGTACSSGTSATTTTVKTTPPPKAETGPTLAALTASVQAQITGTGPSDFSVSGVAKVTCTLPPVWRTGASFTCYAYDFAQDELGLYSGTVAPDSGTTPEWTGVWSPK
jgi:hypothetical protein